MELTEKYRPKTWEEVIGQELLLASLRRQLLSSRPARSLLFEGPTGVGKTSIAQISGRELLCDKPTVAASPCECPQCSALRRGEPHLDYREESLSRTEQVEAVFDEQRYRPMAAQRRVAIFDEADQLSPRAATAMLGWLEEPPPWAHTILVTTRIERLPQTITTRCSIYQLRPVRFEPCLQHLHQICKGEQLQPEPDVLDLIARTSSGNVRRLLKLLEQATEADGRVTEHKLRRFLRLDKVASVIEYVRAVIGGDIDAQSHTIREWDDTPKSKAFLIGTFFLFLLQRYLGLYSSDLMMTAVPADDAADILERIAAIASDAGLVPRTFLQTMLDYWQLGECASQTALDAKMIKFDELFHSTLKLGRAVPSTLLPTLSNRLPTIRPLKPPAQPRRRGVQKVANRERAHLSKKQVSELCDAASFLIQEQGVSLNSRLVVFHERLGIFDQALAIQLVSDLVHQLGLCVNRWTGGSHLHWLYVYERSKQHGLTTTIAAHIPAFLADDVDEWLYERFLPSRATCSNLRAGVRLRVFVCSSAEAQSRRHHYLLRLLCRGVDPRITVLHRDQQRALIDVLGIPRGLRQPLLGAQLVQRWRVSETIGEGVRNGTQLEPLSAFRDKAWDSLFTGWEFQEYDDRQRETRDRADKTASIILKWPSGISEVNDRIRQSQLDELRASWLEDPRHRLRSWLGWWK
jgi:DNA polymerase III subunit gamma/tau